MVDMLVNGYQVAQEKKASNPESQNLHDKALLHCSPDIAGRDPKEVVLPCLVIAT